MDVIRKKPYFPSENHGADGSLAQIFCVLFILAAHLSTHLLRSRCVAGVG
jgi:hypothetical protein